jgi:mycothione reductase
LSAPTGTCLNVGCIPTKMFVYAAEVAETVRAAGRFGVDAHIDRIRWADIRDRIFGRIDPISCDGERARRDADDVTLYSGTAAFSGPRRIVVDTGIDGPIEVTADQVVIATGSRPLVPPIVAASGVPFVTSDSIMRIDRLPDTIALLGGGYIAAEFAHILSALGVQVRIITRGPRLLTSQDEEISRRFTALAQSKWEVHLNVEVTDVRRHEGDVLLRLSDGSSVGASLLLVATGRRPNSDRLHLQRAGVAVHGDGRIRVDDFGRTSAEQVWALGDVSSPFQLKHVANAEARTVGRNLLLSRQTGRDLEPLPHRFIPSAVFTHPQIATVGATSRELKADGRRFVAHTQQYSDTAFGWAMEDQTGVCRLYADSDTGLLLGAHILGPQAATLIQPLIQAMSANQTVSQIARGQYWIHPALTEVIEKALLGLPLP